MNREIMKQGDWRMYRAEFLDILKTQLSGQMHEGKIAAHLRYYEDYIQSKVRAGTPEEEVIAQLGDPRLIAKTLLDTDTGEEVYEESRSYSESDAGNYGNQEEKTWKKKLDLSTWYGKLIVIAAAAVIIFLLISVLAAVLPFLIVFAVIVYLISRWRKR